MFSHFCATSRLNNNTSFAKMFLQKKKRELLRSIFMMLLKLKNIVCSLQVNPFYF